MRPHAQLRSMHSVLEWFLDCVASSVRFGRAYISLVLSSWFFVFAFLTSILRSQPENDDSLPKNTTKKCDKKQPQGRIADLLRKQAQQMPSDTGSGLRPTDGPSLLCGAKKQNHFKGPAPPRSDMATSIKGRPLGSLEKVIVRTDQPRHATRDRCISTAAGHVSFVNAAISAAPPDTDSDLKRESVAQCSTIFWCGPLSQSEKPQKLSTRASVSQSVGVPTGGTDSGPSLAVHRRAGILSQRQAPPVSTSTHKKRHHLNSMDRPAALLPSTQLSHEILEQASMSSTSPPGPPLMYTWERPAVEATRTHRIVEKPNYSPKKLSRGTQMYSTLIFGERLIVCS